MTNTVVNLPWYFRILFAFFAGVAGDASCVYSSLTTMHILPYSRKRGYSDSFGEANDDLLSFNIIGVPAKLSRHEVRPESVASCDVQFSFEIEDGSELNVYCTVDDNRLTISILRSDGRIEKRSLYFPDHADTNSVCLCFDTKGHLLVGLNFLPGHRHSRTIS